MPARYIPALIIVIALLGAAIYSYKVESSYISEMSITPGVVIGLGSKSTSSTTINGKKTSTNTQALVDFKVANATYRAEGRAMGFPRWNIGQNVEVYFSQINPRESRIKRWDEVYFFTTICSFFLSFALLFGTINFVIYKVRGQVLS